MCEPVSPEKESRIFSSSTNHLGMRWMFCKKIQWPSLLPYSILLLATSSWPWPREMLKNDFPASILYLSLSFFIIFSTYLTGSEPGERMKKIGIWGSESAKTDDKISRKDDFESISMNYSPLGSTYLMNLDKATVILSGLRHLKTSSFLNGVLSSFFHSNGSLTSSGWSSLYQSLNLVGASFYMFWAKILNYSSCESAWTIFQAVSGSQSRVFSTPGLGIPLIKKSISSGVYATSITFLFISLNVIIDKKISLCFSKSPLETHW